MPTQFTDFTNAFKHNDQFKGIGDLLPNILEGYKTARAPEVMNTDLELKKAQVTKALADAQNSQNGGNLQGLAREWSDFYKLEQGLGAQHPIVKGAKRDLENRAKSAEILQTQRSLYTRLKPHSELTADEKAHIASQWRGLGIDPQRGLELYSQGISPENAAEQRMQNAIMQGQSGGQNMQQGGMQNYDSQPSQPSQQSFQGQNISANTVAPPIVPFMTGGNTSDYNTLQGALAEEGYIAPWIAESYEPYAAKYSGYSPKQFFDTFKHDPDAVEKMANFYAARAMQPEVAGNRARLANSSTAHQAIDDIKHDSLNAIKIMDWRVSPKAYKRAQEIISEKIQGMGRARGKGLSGQINPETMQGAIQNSPQNPSQSQSNFDPDYFLKKWEERKKR